MIILFSFSVCVWALCSTGELCHDLLMYHDKIVMVVGLLRSHFANTANWVRFVCLVDALMASCFRLYLQHFHNTATNRMLIHIRLRSVWLGSFAFGFWLGLRFVLRLGLTLRIAWSLGSN